MKMVSLQIAVLVLSAMLLFSACSKENGVAPATQHPPEQTEAVMGEDWPEESSVQSTVGEESQQTVTDSGEMIPPASEEIKPVIDEEEKKPTDAPQTPQTGTLDYVEYLALSATERQAYVESFSSMEEAMLWYAAAQKEYEESQDKIDISGGSIDLGEILGDMGK